MQSETPPDYPQLITHLETRLSVIADTELRKVNPELQLQQLQEVSEQINQWHTDHQSSIPAQLNHFLTNASLVKALEYLKSGSQKCK